MPLPVGDVASLPRSMVAVHMMKGELADSMIRHLSRKILLFV